MKAYYGSRISENRTKTPEGYLICHNTPIARLGKQEYAPEELGISGKETIWVNRTENEVFTPATIASFEGKPVTDDHPSCDEVRPDNIDRYMRGVTTNVRRGSGNEVDLLLADLIIYNPILISEIESGKREVSCGYNYTLTQSDDGSYIQTDIKGNHVAIVCSGRAGSRVRVKDEKIKGGNKMSKYNKNTIIGKLLSAFAKDAEPEELAEASKMMQAQAGDNDEPALANVPALAPTTTTEPTPATDTSPEVLQVLQGLTEALTSLKAEVAALKSAHDDEPDPVQAMDELEKELTQDADPDESTTIAADDEGPVAPADTLPENPIPGADSRTAILMALKAARPVVAQIKDPDERKKAADAMTKAFREQLHVQPTDNYRKLATPAKPKSAKDSTDDLQQLGRNWAKKWNPHYKNRGQA